MLLIRTFPGSTVSQDQPQRVLVNPLGWSTFMSGCANIQLHVVGCVDDMPGAVHIC